MLSLREIDRSRLSLPRRVGASSYFDYEKDILAVSSGSGSIVHVAAHEMGHWFDHVSSPYGFFLDGVNRSEQRCAFEYFHLHQQAGLPMVAPAYDFVKRLSTARGSLRGKYRAYLPLTEEIVHIVRRWSNIVHIKQMLDDPSGMREPSIGRAIESLSIQEQYEAKIRDVAGHLHLESAHDIGLGEDGVSTFAPFVEMAGHKNYIGAGHIFELLAVLGEMNRASDYVRRRELDKDYNAAYFLFFALAMEEGIDLEDVEEYHYCLKLIFLCGKLALFSPIGFYRGLRKNRSLKWRDVHPGHRFFAAARVGLHLQRICRRLPFDQVQGVLCEHFNWPEVEQFVNELILLEPKTTQERRHVSYMRLYAATEFSIVSPEPSLEDEWSFRPIMDSEILSLYGPLFVDEGSPNILMRKNDSDRCSFVVNYCFRGLCNDVMLNGRFQEFLVAPEIQNFVFTKPSDLFSGILDLGIHTLDPEGRRLWQRVFGGRR